MRRIKDFLSRHKVLCWVLGIFLGIVLLDSIINNDYEKFLSMIYSLFMLCIYLFIFYLMLSKKNYLCPKCKKKINKGQSLCEHCGEKIDGKSKKIIPKRIFLKSRLFYMIGEAFIFIPIGMGFLYLLLSPIVFATNGESITHGNTLFVFYTKSHLLPIALTLTSIGIVFVLFGVHFQKKEKKMQ